MGVNRYLGGVVSADPNTPTVTSASGTWTLEEAYQNIGNWPMAQSQIQNSLRFNSADSAYLSRTPATAGTSTQKFTFSTWVKRCKTGEEQWLLGTRSGTTYTAIVFTSGDAFQYVDSNAGTIQCQLLTTQLFRDPSAWYHIVVAVDTTQATQADRQKIWVNGVQVSAFTTNTQYSQNANYVRLNQAYEQTISREPGSSKYLNGYMTEVYMVDGLGLSADYFGFTDANGIWQPKPYKGAYGTNGFYLNFSDNSNNTATTLGKDYSGNSNNWTPNNFSVTTDSDSMVDTPTPYGTDTGAGGEVRGNYATLNPLFVNTSYPITYSNGNLSATRASGGQGGVTNTIGMSSGKWYWEVVYSTYPYTFGITTNPAGSTSGSENIAGYNGGGGTSIGLQPNGVLRTNGTAGSTYTSWTTGDVMGIALDMDGGNLYFYKNGTAMNSGSPVATSLTGSTWFFITSLESGASLVANFGQTPFAYAAPSGYKALCTQNLSDPTIADGSQYFDVALYTGNGYPTSGTQSITGLEFQPDFLWIKDRSRTGYNHFLQDVLRGSTKVLRSNTTGAEGTESTAVTSFNSNGFSLGANNEVNYENDAFVGWSWKAGGTGTSIAAGSIDGTNPTIASTVSANPAAGFSIVTYTGNNSANQTVAHGLGVAPSFGILKDRDPNSNNDQWQIFHTAAGDKYGYFTTAAFTGTAEFYPTSGSSDTVTIARSSPYATTNESGDRYVMYLFAPVAGYSAFGSYTGNTNADGPFVYLGFRPAFVLIKDISNTYSWNIFDDKRSNDFNYVDARLYPDLSNQEQSAVEFLDFTSNGFKLRINSASINGSSTFIYAAFAENPFKLSRAR